MYKLLAGGISAQRRLDAMASNVSNASTPGFVPERVSVHGRQRAGFVLPKPASEPDAAPAPVTKTGNPLDVAPANGLFLMVQTPRGERLTRAGALTQSADGTLITTTGYPVLTDGGEVSADRSVSIRGEGDVYAGAEFLGRLRLVELIDRRAATREGDNLLNAPPLAYVDTETPQIDPGALVASGVQPVEAMVEVISTSRAFEAYQQAIRTLYDADRHTANLGRI